MQPHFATALASASPTTPGAIMAAVRDKLARQKIDVAGTAPRGQGSAILRPLAEMPAPSAEELREESDFSVLFREAIALDAAGYTMALCADGEVIRTSVRDRPTYRAQWNATAVDRRVFLSFTRRDLRLARIVQAALEGEGLRVFTYLANEDNRIWTNSVDVGHYFESAGHHFVVDTPNARASVATRFEQLAVSDLWRRTSTAPSLEDAVQRLRAQALFAGVPSKNANVCCRICLGRSGQTGSPERHCQTHRASVKKTHCGAVICGSQCQNAY